MPNHTLIRELEAMRRIEDAVKGLDQNEQRRVMAWVIDKYIPGLRRHLQ